MIHKKVILVYSDLAKITLLVRLVRPQDCAWCPLGETFLAHLLDPLVDLRLIGSGILLGFLLRCWILDFYVLPKNWVATGTPSNPIPFVPGHFLAPLITKVPGTILRCPRKQHF